MALTERMRMIISRGRAYRTVFGGEPLMDHRKAAAIVMADLARFCRARSSTAIVSPVSRTTDVPATFMGEGRREVFNRIFYYSNLSEAEVAQLQEQGNETS